MRPPSPPTHVLAFAEDESRAAVIKSLLSGVLGVTTEMAFTVSHIQRYCAAAPVDVILLDLKDSAGSETLDLIRQLSAPGQSTSHIPLTALLNEESDGDIRISALEAGLQEIFVEPVDEIHLLTRLVLLGRIRQAEDAIRQLAITDQETGLFDGRYLLLRLGEELSRARRYSRPLTCVMGSIDHLPAGDTPESALLRSQLLRHAAALVQVVKRDIDVLARSGPDELSLLLYNTDVPGTVVLCERIRKQMAQLELSELAQPLQCTFGIASVKPDEELSMHPEEFRHRAELALRQAQEQGGGGNVVYVPEFTRQMVGA